MGKLSLKEFFETELRAGQTQDDPNYKRLHYYLGKVIEQRLNPQSILEIGCGTGALMEYFIRATNVEYTGIDINPHSRDYFLERNPGFENNYVLKDILEFPITTHGDLVVSIETMEHIEQDVIDVILPKLARHYKWFYFSSTPFKTTPEQDLKWGHVNIQADHQWVRMFRKHGWQFASWMDTPTEWSMLFESGLRK